MNLAAGDDRDLLVEQIDHAAEDAALRLTAKTEQNEVVPRQDGIDQLRHDRLVVADDPREQGLAGSQFANEIVPDFLLDRLRERAGLPAQVAEGLSWGRHGSILSGLDQPSPRAFPFLSSGRPLVFAHRGGAALAPENTFAAFDNGLALGADGLEPDVHLSRDGQVMVHHDADARPNHEPSRARYRVGGRRPSTRGRGTSLQTRRQLPVSRDRLRCPHAVRGPRPLPRCPRHRRAKGQ